jgi:1-phosphofructokinase
MSDDPTPDASPLHRVCVFSPLPMLTITVEPHGEDDYRVHIHAGGQGVWVARMVCTMEVQAHLVGCFGGETGLVATSLVRSEGIELTPVNMSTDTPSYVHDRRGGDREIMVEPMFPALERHALDELYTAALGAGLGSDVAVLTGVPVSNAIEDDTYRRLASDLRSNGQRVVADLHGAQLCAALEAGLTLLKISDEELQEDGLLRPKDAANVNKVVAAGIELRNRGAEEVVISRSSEPAVVSIDGEWFTVHGPDMQVVDYRGAGDSMTAALAVGLAKGLSPSDTIRLATAAGSLNVTRHGLATGRPETIREIAHRVDLRPIG